jgi:hypothetical protein
MTAALNYAAPLPSLNLVTAPSGTIFAGDTATVPFAVKALAGDGTTPIAGQPVTFTASGAAVQFGACGGPVCTLATDASGLASTTVTPLGAGDVTVSAASAVGTQAASFTVRAKVRTVTPIVAVQYVAAAATVVWTPQVNVNDNSAPTAGVLVNWQATAPGILFSPPQSSVNALGVAETQATVGPLAAGDQATATACAWSSICATFAAQAVDPADWRIEIVSGAGQSVAADGVLASVILRVTDTAGHPIEGALVEIHQTVDAWQGPCPAHGRCSVPPGEYAQTSSATSDAEGLVTVLPVQVAETAEITNIVAATGTMGFVSLSLEKQP